MERSGNPNLRASRPTLRFCSSTNQPPSLEAERTTPLDARPSRGTISEREGALAAFLEPLPWQGNQKGTMSAPGAFLGHSPWLEDPSPAQGEADGPPASERSEGGKGS